MHQFFHILKERPSHQLTEDEIAIASGKKVLDTAQTKDFIKNLEAVSENIREAFGKQANNAAVSSFNISSVFGIY